MRARELGGVNCGETATRDGVFSIESSLAGGRQKLKRNNSRALAEWQKKKGGPDRQPGPVNKLPLWDVFFDSSGQHGMGPGKKRRKKK
jgi:hypothetical protein